jgi:hypothetical protein
MSRTLQADERHTGRDENRAAEAHDADLLPEHECRKAGCDHDARLPDGCHGRCRRAREGREHQPVGAEGGEAGERRRRAHLGGKRAPSPQAREQERIADAREDHRELQIDEGGGVPNPMLVHERVGGDEARQDETEDHPDRVRLPLQAADEHDPEPHEAHPGGLVRGRARPERRDPDQKHEDRRGTPGDRIDDRELRSAVGRGEESGVDELEEGGDDQVRDRRPLQVPRQRRHGCKRYEREEKHDRSRGLRVSRPRQEQVPEGVQERRGDREGEGDGGHEE